MTTKLKPETAEAYDRYIKAVEHEIEARNTGELPFLVSDKDPRSRLRLQQGEIIIQSLKEDIDIPNGIVHDWNAAMFVPGLTAEQMIGVLQDYDNHKDIYPEVVESRLLSRDGDTFRYFHRLRKKKVLTVVLNTENEARFEKIAENRWFVRSTATKISEVKDPGKANETERPVGEDGGFLWRMDAAWRLEESDGGVYAEVGAVTLSRSIPFGLGWIVRPFIESMPRESLEGLLQATRVAAKR
jgi:hypothetical protein